jgi:hypothetical protein
MSAPDDAPAPARGNLPAYMYDEPQGELPRPLTVRRAFAVWVTIAGAWLLGTVIVMTVRTEDLRAGIVRVMWASGADPSESAVDSLVVTTQVIRIVTAAVISGLFLLFAIRMQQGRNWARITITLLGVATVGYALVFLPAVSTVDGLFLGAQVIMAALATVLMYLPASSRYFAEAGRR